MCFGLFMVMLDNTVVNLALPTLQRELNSGLTGLQWIVDAFTLLLASLMLTGGTLGDLYGRKRLFMGGLALFTAGSLLCALSPSVGMLIGGRAVQGLGAAMLLPATLAILTYTFHDPRERAQAIGIWAGISGLGLAMGPVLGGVMVDAFGWQSIFYLNVPIGLAALVITARVVRESKNPQARGLDIPGQILAVTGLASLTYAFIEANNYGWGSARIITLFILAGVALAAFAVWETRAREPMLQLSFFRNVTFAGANIVGMLVNFGFFGMLFFLALFMQNVQGFSPTGAGVRQLPNTLAVGVVAVIAGRIVGRVGARLPVTVGMFLLGSSILLFETVQATTPYSAYWWILLILGVGTGLVFSPMTTAVMTTVPTAQAGIASATFNTTRQVGGVFGIALLGSIVTGRFGADLKGSLSALGLPQTVTEKIVAIAQQGQGTAGAFPSTPGVDASAIRAAISDSFTTGLHRGLWVCGIVVLVGAMFSAVMFRGTSPKAQLARRTAARTAAARNAPAALELPAEQPE